MTPHESKKTWQPYESHHSFIRSWVALRWKLTQPFLTTLIHFKGFHVTIGDLVLVLPITGAILFYAVKSYMAKDVEESGAFPTLSMGLAFLFACHNSILTFLTGLPFERALVYHKLAAFLAIITGALHGVVYLLHGEGDDREEAFSGILLFGTFCLLCLTSLPPFRRKFFELFYRCHWILFLASIGLAVVHGAGGVGLGFLFWAFDIFFRYGKTTQVHPRKVLIQRLPGNIVRITFDRKDFHYRSGQYVFLCVPQLSIFEWHPFSISSAPTETNVSIHIRTLGDWTKKLWELAPEEPKSINVFLEGPYGEPSINIDGNIYSHFLMISGGIGVTPLKSMTDELFIQHQNGRPIQKCWFVWSVRDLCTISAIYENEAVQTRLPVSFRPHSDPSSSFYSEFYLTKEPEEEVLESANIHSNVQKCLRFNRPKIDTIFQEMHDLSKGETFTRVAVLVCGPESMVDDVYRFGRKFSSKYVQFDIHSETFSF